MKSSREQQLSLLTSYASGLGTLLLKVFVKAAKRNIEKARGVNEAEMKAAEARLAVYEKELETR